jgi:anti-sigma B factor antagonist
LPLSLQSRRVGNIAVVKCKGRIVEGAEASALRDHLNALLPQDPYIILDLGEVHFIDSSGLGLLIRFLTRTQTAGGNLTLCSVPASIGRVLKITHLRGIFGSHESQAEAISTFYTRTTPAGTLSRFNTDILCVEKSANVQAYVRELLGQWGYGVITAGTVPDALMLLNATAPKVVVIGADLRMITDTPAAAIFKGLSDTMTVIELPPGFSHHDAGEAGHHLLERVRAAMGERDGPAIATQTRSTRTATPPEEVTAPREKAKDHG